jgi:hypothetical protein
MTDGTRILRTVAVPIIVAVVLLLMVPKSCARVVQVSKARAEKAAQQSSGLRIESSQKPVNFPSGLNPDRIRYLVEIDTHFSAPYVAHLSKTPSATDQTIVAALKKLGYADLASDGTLTITRDGTLHLDGLVDDGSSWAFVLAKRQFQSITSIESETTGAHAHFAWTWQPNAAGAELIPSLRHHGATAELSSVGGRWSLTGIADLDNELE